MSLNHEPAVMMEIPAIGGEPSYDRVELHDLTHTPYPHRPALRVLRIGEDRLTRPLIDYLDDTAHQLYLASNEPATRRVVENAVREGGPGATLWFAVEHGRLIEPVAPATVAAMATTLRRRANPHATFLMVDQGDGSRTAEEVWANFEHSIAVFATGDFRTEARAGQATAAYATPSPIDASMSLRDELLALNWPVSGDVAQRNGSRAANKAQWARDKRHAGELLGVWSASEKTYRHPSFQFDAAGILRPRVKELLAALATNPEFTAAEDAGGWRRTFWLYGATAALAAADGTPRVPADLFADDPDAVIGAARMDAESGEHDW